ncbi:hypothetical protein ACHAPJ_013545 [Fusarium lateritium]
MGDSANFKYAIQEVGDPFDWSAQNRVWADNLQRYMTEQLGSTTRNALQVLQSEKEDRLKRDEAFNYPEKYVRDVLAQVFFSFVFPSCPIFDQVEFMKLYEAQTMSPLVLNAVFFVASLHCPESTISNMGFTSRYLASLTFYQRAKALHDAGFESDGVATIQATILMSHHCDAPMEQKDTYNSAQKYRHIP